MLIRPLNVTQNDLCTTSDKNTNFNSSKNLLAKSGFQILYAVEQFSSLFSKDKLKQGAHIHQTHDLPSPRMSWENCRAVPANSSHMCCVQLVLNSLLCTHLSRKRLLRHGFSPFINPMVLPPWWAPIRVKQLSVAATARMIWLCAC